MQNSLIYIDAHAHLNFDAFDNDRQEVITQMKTKGIGAINVGVDFSTSQASTDIAGEHENIWASVGCHPTEATDDFDIDLYNGLMEKGRNVVSVGECGLDYYRKKHRGEKEKELQEVVFTAQIQLALSKKLPLILHIRPRENTMDAYTDGLDILEHYSQKYGDDLRGTAHFFVGNKDIARRFLDIGFFLSATGPVTFDDRLQEVFTYIPTDHLIVETDAPFAAPVSYRGQRNSPLYISEIVDQLATLHDQPAEVVAKKITSNTQRLFSL